MQKCLYKGLCPKLSTNLKDKYIIEDDEQLENIFHQFIRISLNYNDWFRDGQDSGNRDFSFSKNTKIELQSGNVTKNISILLDVSSDKASEIIITYNKNECVDTNIREILSKYFGDKGSSKDVEGAETVDFIYLVTDVKKYKDRKDFEKQFCD